VYQLELSTGSAGKWGTVSEVQSAETAVLIAGMAERDVGTAAVPT
jgi:ribosomal protein L24